MRKRLTLLGCLMLLGFSGQSEASPVRVGAELTATVQDAEGMALLGQFYANKIRATVAAYRDKGQAVRPVSPTSSPWHSRPRTQARCLCHVSTRSPSPYAPLFDIPQSN